jgi:hypothetical protein
MADARTKRPGSSLAVVVGGARSGTTLLRLFLDAHPEIGCPAEASVPAWIAQSTNVWRVVCADKNGHEDRLPHQAESAIRRSVRDLMRAYCAPGSKRVYCDKSLDSYEHLEAVRRIFPRVRVVLVVRHVMDTIASGIEASPWGFSAYGFTPFVRASPENFVAALAAYWERCLAAALEWEGEHPKQCHRVRYEDLVANPSGVLADVFRFLGVATDVDVVQRHFGTARVLGPPGDYKVAFTDAVSTASVGRGKHVPVAMIPPPLRERLSTLLTTFGYAALDESWNAAPDDGGRAEPAVRLGLAAALDTATFDRRGGGVDVDSFAIVADDDVDLRWVVDAGRSVMRRGDGEVEVVLTGTARDLLAFITGDTNVGALLRSNRIRCVTSRDDGPMAFGYQAQMVLEIARHLRCGVARVAPVGRPPAGALGRSLALAD